MSEESTGTVFRFRQFSVSNSRSAMRITTDSVLLGAWADVEGTGRILDVGTGTGVIAMMMAQRNIRALVTGIEIDRIAAMEAQDNFAASPWRERLAVITGDYTETAACDGIEPFDLIISNPPFFASGAKAEDKRRADARHGTTLNIGSLLSCSGPWLAPSGHVALIAPSLRDDDVEFEAVLNGFSVMRHTQVITRVHSDVPERSLWLLSKAPGVRRQHDILRLRDSDNNYTQRYKRLVSDFYLWMN